MTINLNEMTIGDFKEISRMLQGGNSNSNDGLSCQLGEYVIIRTYSAGVWFGKLDQKSGSEVILTEARRMWSWKANKAISLSGVAKHGIDRGESRIQPALEKVWLNAIEILTLSDVCIESIKGAEDDEAR